MFSFWSALICVMSYEIIYIIKLCVSNSDLKLRGCETDYWAQEETCSDQTIHQDSKCSPIFTLQLAVFLIKDCLSGFLFGYINWKKACVELFTPGSRLKGKAMKWKYVIALLVQVTTTLEKQQEFLFFIWTYFRHPMWHLKNDMKRKKYVFFFQALY